MPNELSLKLRTRRLIMATKSSINIGKRTASLFIIESHLLNKSFLLSLFFSNVAK